MEFREIATFLQAAKLQSFSKAASQLGYSQAAVTIQIKQLERELGVHLFDRIGKQTTLTHQGQVFYGYASAIMRDLAQAKDAMADPVQLTGQLCLGTIESICSSIFPELLTEYYHRFPRPAFEADECKCHRYRLFSGQTDLRLQMEKGNGTARADPVCRLRRSPFSQQKAAALFDRNPVLPFRPHRKRCQLPVHSGPVSGIGGDYAASLSRNREYRLYSEIFTA